MIVNAANLGLLFTGFKASFQSGFSTHAAVHPQIATEVPSGTEQELYAWLGQMPNLREWLGDRVVHGIASHDYSIKNKLFEMTVGVPKTKIEDDTYGIYKPVFEGMGVSSAEHPDRLVFDAVRGAFDTACYDKQAFFSAEHIKLNEKGKEVAVSNMQAGDGPAWFLLDLSKPLKPFIYQKRKAYEFIAKTSGQTSDHVFMKNEFLYGVEGRGNAGYGFWQVAFGSKAPLTSANFRAARQAMLKMTGDYDRKIGVRPTHIMVGPSNSDKARDILLASQINATTNVDQNLVKIIDTVWLD